MAKPHKIEQHLKKESLLKFNVKLTPKLSQSQNLSKAKADPNSSQSQRWAKAMGMVIIGIDTVVGLPLVYVYLLRPMTH